MCVCVLGGGGGGGVNYNLIRILASPRENCICKTYVNDNLNK